MRNHLKRIGIGTCMIVLSCWGIGSKSTSALENVHNKPPSVSNTHNDMKYGIKFVCNHATNKANTSNIYWKQFYMYGFLFFYRVTRESKPKRQNYISNNWSFSSTNLVSYKLWDTTHINLCQNNKWKYANTLCCSASCSIVHFQN